MAQFKAGDLREAAFARFIVDPETGFAVAVDADGGVRVQGELEVNVLTLNDGWTLETARGYSADDWFTIVPAGQIWQILYFAVIYGSSGVAGDRTVAMRVNYATVPYYTHLGVSGVVQAASLMYEYMFAPGVADLTAVRDTALVSTPIPVATMLEAGDEVGVYDRGGVSGADDMTTHLRYAWQEV